MSDLTLTDLTKLNVRDSGVLANLDPHLQQMVVCRKYGQRTSVRASASADEVVVTARVTDADLWVAQSEVRLGLVIPGENPGDDAIVTGRIPMSRIEAIRKLPFVVSLKASRPLRRTLAATVAETGAATPPAGSLANGGKGAIVGIVDFGGDFAHQNFRNADGTTRLLGIWYQAGQRRPADPVPYGRFFTPAEINAALKKPDPYTALGYPVPVDSGSEHGTHGTHVMDIAAGNGRGSGVAGMAPNADLLFVEAETSDIPWGGPDVLQKSFGDSVQLLEALDFIFRTAGTRPCSINVSLGTNGGPHDGSTLVEQGIDRLLTQQSNRCVSIAASNSFADGIHASGSVAQGAFFDLLWTLEDGDQTGNEFELWYAGADRFAVELFGPDGHSLVRVEPGQTRQLAAAAGQPPVIVVANRLNDPNNHDNTMGIFLNQQLPGGDWKVRLHGVTVTNGHFDAWIERDDFGPSAFAEAQRDDSHTLGSISTGRKTIVVASFDAHKPQLPLSWFSSSGPTRDGRPKPEISAPGHDVLAAHSRTGSAVTSKSGTSMAAPAVTGGIAVVLAEAAARGKSLTIDQLRDMVIRAARRNPPAGAAFDARYGNGRLFLPTMLAELIAAGGAPPAMSPKKAPAKKSTKKAPAKKAAKKTPAKKATKKNH